MEYDNITSHNQPGKIFQKPATEDGKNGDSNPKFLLSLQSLPRWKWWELSRQLVINATRSIFLEYENDPKISVAPPLRLKN